MKRWIASTLALTMMTAVLTGCGGQTPPANGGNAVTPNTGGEGKTYTIRIACNEEGARAENLILAAENLQAELTAAGSKDIIKAEYLLVKDDYGDQMAMWDKTGDLPEIVVASSPRMRTFWDAGFLVPADEVAASAAYKTVFPNLMDGMKVEDGKFMAVPQDTEARGVWFNRNHLKSLGWTDQQIADFPAVVEKGNFTEADLQKLAKEAVDKKISQWGIIHRPTKGTEWNMMLLNHAKGEYPMEDGKVIIDQNALKGFLTFIKQNVDLGLTPKENTTYGWDIIEGDICPSGKTLSWYGGVWNKYDLMNAGNVTAEYVDENFIMTLAPVVNKGDKPLSISSSMTYAMTKQAQTDPQLYDYVKRTLEHVLDPEIQLNTTIGTAHLAIDSVTAEYPAYKENKFLSDCTYMLNYSILLPPTQEYTMSTDINLYEAIQSVEMGTASVEEAVKAMVDKATYEIGEGKYILK